MSVKLWIDWNADGDFSPEEEMSHAAVGRLTAQRGSSFRNSARRGGDAGRLSVRLRALPEFAKTAAFRNGVSVGNIKLDVRLNIGDTPMWQGHLTSLTYQRKRQRTEYLLQATGALALLANDFPNRASTQLITDGTVAGMLKTIRDVEDCPVWITGSDREFAQNTFDPGPAQWFITNASYLSQLKDIEDGSFGTLYEGREKPRWLYLRSPRGRRNLRSPQFSVQYNRMQTEKVQQDLTTVANVVQPHYRRYEPHDTALTWRVQRRYSVSESGFLPDRSTYDSNRGRWRVYFQWDTGISFSVADKAADAGAFARSGSGSARIDTSSTSWGLTVTNRRLDWTSTWEGRHYFTLAASIYIQPVRGSSNNRPTWDDIRNQLGVVLSNITVTTIGSVRYFTDPEDIVAPPAFDLTSRKTYGPRDYPLATFWSSAEEVAAYAATRLAITKDPYYIGSVRFRPTPTEIQRIDIGAPGNIEIEEGMLPVIVEAIKYDIRAGGVIDMTLQVSAQEPWNGRGVIPLAGYFF